MLNDIALMGRLTRDPELRSTASGLSVANFTLAVERDVKAQDGSREVDFIDCVAWRKSAEFAAKYFHKGDLAAVRGRLTIRDWTDKDGGKRKSAEVVAEAIYFGGGKRSAEGSREPENHGYGPAYVQPGEELPLLTDEDGQLPF